MPKTKGKVTKLHWQDLPGAEERLQQLRDRDLEIAKLSLGLQMRTRITTLEEQLNHFQSLESIWRVTRMGRIYYALRTIAVNVYRFTIKK